MLVTKQQLEARQLASKDLERFDITHLKITPSAQGPGADVVATNGHLAVRVKSRELPGESEVPLAPRQGGTDPDRAVYLHAAAAAEAAKVLPKNPELPSFQVGRLRVEERTRGASLSIGASDTLTHHVVTTEEPDSLRYPDVEQILAAQRLKVPVVSVLLSADYVALVAKFAKQFAAVERPAIKLTYYGPGEAVGFEWEDPRHTVQGLLMPMRDATAQRTAAAEPATATADGAPEPLPPLETADPDVAVAGMTPLVPDTLEGVEDARARALLNARAKAAAAAGRRATNSDEPVPVP